MPLDRSALAALASRTVVAAAASTDAWGTAKRGVARLLGRGDPERERLAAWRLDQTRDQLQAAPVQELDQARADLEAVWGTRLGDFLEEQPDSANELRVLVGQIQAKLPAGTAAAAEKARKRKLWRDALQPLPTIFDWYKANAFVGTALAAGFVALKCYVLAEGNLATALGILQYVGLATVVVASLLSSLPVLAAAMLYLTVYRAVKASRPEPGWSGLRGFFARLGKLPRELAWTGLGALGLCVLLTPWPYMAVAAALGLVTGARPVLVERGRASFLVAYIRVLLGLVTGVAVVLMLYTVWVPREIVVFQPGTLPSGTVSREIVVGYVLSEDNGWITMLTSGAHRILRYPDAKVTTQIVCETLPGSFWQEVTNASSLWDNVIESPMQGLHPVTIVTCPYQV